MEITKNNTCYYYYKLVLWPLFQNNPRASARKATTTIIKDVKHPLSQLPAYILHRLHTVHRIKHLQATFHYAILVAERPEAGRRPAASWNLAYHLVR